MTTKIKKLNNLLKSVEDPAGDFYQFLLNNVEHYTTLSNVWRRKEGAEEVPFLGFDNLNAMFAPTVKAAAEDYQGRTGKYIKDSIINDVISELGNHFAEIEED